MHNLLLLLFPRPRHKCRQYLDRLRPTARRVRRLKVARRMGTDPGRHKRPGSARAVAQRFARPISARDAVSNRLVQCLRLRY